MTYIYGRAVHGGVCLFVVLSGKGMRFCHLFVYTADHTITVLVLLLFYYYGFFGLTCNLRVENVHANSGCLLEC